jgi:aminoglycoside/choline kinase family phosphotransferase
VIALAPDVDALLRAHGIGGAGLAIADPGYMGAIKSRFTAGGRRYILKRISPHDVWMRDILRDRGCREFEFAISGLAERMPPGLRVPNIGAARDGDGWALLMHDLTDALLPRHGRLPHETVARIIDAVAGMHASFWREPLDDAGVTWVTTEQQLRMLSPETGRLLIERGMDFGLLRGWEVFDRLAPAAAVSLVRELRADPTPLIAALAALPQTLLHGDVKCDNIAIDGTTVWLFDWQLTQAGPVALELAWLLAVNSSRLPDSLEETAEQYRTSLERALGRRAGQLNWPRQLALTAVVGLLRYGWGKALDSDAASSEARSRELDWWCERAVAGAAAL